MTKSHLHEQSATAIIAPAARNNRAIEKTTARVQTNLISHGTIYTHRPYVIRNLSRVRSAVPQESGGVMFTAKILMHRAPQQLTLTSDWIKVERRIKSRRGEIPRRGYNSRARLLFFFLSSCALETRSCVYIGAQCTHKKCDGAAERFSRSFVIGPIDRERLGTSLSLPLSLSLSLRCRVMHRAVYRRCSHVLLHARSASFSRVGSRFFIIRMLYIVVTYHLEYLGINLVKSLMNVTTYIRIFQTALE